MDAPLRLPPQLEALLPQDPVSQNILVHTRASLTPPIFNHSLRVYLLAQRLSDMESQANTQFTHPSQITTTSSPGFDHTTLFAAAMFHDMGTCAVHNGSQRFEVEGADAAVSHLCSQGYTDPASLHAVWCAITLHTSAGIAERIDPFTRLIRLGVKSDFAPPIRDSLGLTAYAAEIETALPRLDIEQCLAGAVVAQATRGEKDQGIYAADGSGRWIDSPKFPKASWPGVLFRGHMEKVRDVGKEWKGPNPAF